MATEQAQTSASTTTAATTDTDGPDEVPQRDYAKLLVTDDSGATNEEAAAETPAAEEKVETPEPEAKEPEATATAETTETKPGTPDKVLQRMQQDLSAATRKLDELAAKQDAGQTLTSKEKAEVATQQRKLDVVRKALKDKGREFDLLDDGMGEAIAETLDEHDRTVQQLHQELQATKAEVAEMRQATAAQKQAAQWQATEAKYPGINVRDMWEKAASDAVEASGFTVDEINAKPDLARMITNVASKTFFDRADAALKSIEAKKPVAPPPEKKPTATRSTPPLTPGGARVAQSSGVATTSDPDDFTVYRNRAAALVKD